MPISLVNVEFHVFLLKKSPDRIPLEVEATRLECPKHLNQTDRHVYDPHRPNQILEAATENISDHESIQFYNRHPLFSTFVELPKYAREHPSIKSRIRQ